MITRRLTSFLLVIVAAFTMSGCELIGDVLQFGVWLGVIIVVVVIALVLWIIRKIRR
jgi:FtsH-binding integral membrane protein